MPRSRTGTRIHFDQQFTRDVAHLEATVINGALKQHLIAQFLGQAFPQGWLWRIDYRFVGQDRVGEKLRVQGHVTSSQASGEHHFVSVRVEIMNLDRAELTTLGEAVVVLAQDGSLVLDALGIELPVGMSLSQEVAALDSEVAAGINAWLGKQIDARESLLRHRPQPPEAFRRSGHGARARSLRSAGRRGFRWGGVVAAPLFPLHGLEAMPGSYPLSEEPNAQGREGSMKSAAMLQSVSVWTPRAE